jgi:hypothetical protein
MLKPILVFNKSSRNQVVVENIFGQGFSKPIHRVEKVLKIPKKK